MIYRLDGVGWFVFMFPCYPRTLTCCEIAVFDVVDVVMTPSSAAGGGAEWMARVDGVSVRGRLNPLSHMLIGGFKGSFQSSG